MIKKTPFHTHEILDEPIYFEFKEGIKRAVYTSSGAPVTLRSEYNHVDKALRTERLKNCKRKKAFSFYEHQILLQDRDFGMSIRQLAMKYNKSTRTIQKYLKMLPVADEMDL